MQKITEIFTWQNYKVEELEKKHKINERAIRDGSGEQPPEKDPGYTVVENEISLECGNYLEEHTEKLRVYLKKVEDSQNILTTHLEQNHFETVVNTLEADFNTIANKKKTNSVRTTQRIPYLQSRKGSISKNSSSIQRT